MSVKIYVEGGGEGQALKTKCRKAFQAFFTAAGLAGRLPRVIPSGGRKQAYDDFCTALKLAGADDYIILLVDSEAPVSVPPWQHVKEREGDRWDRPSAATEDHLQLMVQCMETWFLADKSLLAQFFGNLFRPSALPPNPCLEAIPKDDVLAGLSSATHACSPKQRYSKGRHSFGILEQLDPSKVSQSCPFAERLLRTLTKKTAVES